MKFVKQRNEEQQQMDFMGKLESLAPTGTGFLNLHWILQALDVVLASHTEIHDFLKASPQRDTKFASVFAEENTSLLHFCNWVKGRMSTVHQKKMHIKYVLNLVNNAPVSQEQARVTSEALKDCIAEVKKDKHTGSRLGFGFTSSVKGNSRILSKVMEANMASFLVMNIIDFTFNPCKTWFGGDIYKVRGTKLCPIWRLYQGAREEAEALGENASVSVVLEALCSCLTNIKELVDSWTVFPLDTEQQDKWKRLVQQAVKKFEYFESGFGILEEQMDDLFKKLVANRNQVLAAQKR